LCNAYAAAVTDWNAQTPPREKFNDTLARHVSPKAMQDSLKNTQERGVGFLTKGNDNEVNSLAEIGRRPGAVGVRVNALRSALANRVRSPGGCLNRFRMGGSAMIRGKKNGLGACADFKGKIGRGLHPDFVHPPDSGTPGRPIEVKRPGEPESHPGQKNHYAKCDPNNPKMCDCVPEDCPK
jgi:hypothetical protein